MSIAECPACGLISPGSAQRCECGYDFERGELSREARAAHAAAREAGNSAIIGGIGLIVFGVLLSFFTMAGGAGYLFYGAVIAGIISLVKGLAARARRRG
jgi:hypothetical protein